MYEQNNRNIEIVKCVNYRTAAADKGTENKKEQENGRF